MADAGRTQVFSVPDAGELCAILSDMLPSLPGIIYRCRDNDRWTMLDLDEPVRELTGYRSDELLHDAEISWAELIHPEDRDRVRSEVSEALDKGLAFRTSYRIRTREGDAVRVYEQGRRAGDAEDEIIGFIQEVTGWRERWEQLEGAVNLLERTVASLQEAVFVIDTSGEGRGILSANPAAERMFGYDLEELIGGTTEKLHVSHESFAAFARELDPLLEEKGVVHAAFPMRRKDGTEFAAEQTVALLYPDRGIAGGAVSVVHDVDERRTLENKLRRAQRLEAIGRLAGGVAHDFNNLLTVIRAHADFGAMELEQGDALLAELRAIRSAADRASDLTGQLLAFSREQVLQPRIVDLNEVVRKAKRLLDRVIGENIDVRTTLSPEPLALRIDPGQLEQVIVNLAVNARDAMPDGGRLLLETARETGTMDTSETLDLDDDLTAGPRVRLRVSDTGIGMDAETRERVFEPFFTTKKAGKGTGLGLATAYGFAVQSGGIIQVDSAPGEGSTFTLRFPAADEPVEVGEAGTTDREPLASLRACTVLVVEDDPNVLRVIQKTLGGVGCQVESATTGEAALALLAERGPGLDLVLTDLVLPGIGGLHVVDRALELRIPVLVMSGYAADSPGHHAEIPPEAEFIPKPFTPAGLVQKIREIVSG